MVIVHHTIVKSSSSFLLLNMDTDYFCQYNKTYSEAQETAIAEEFKRIKNEHYLDHAASTMYSEKQLQDICSELAANIFSNPHGSNLSSKQTEDAIDIVRFQILRHFHTNSEEYSVIFTSGATSSLKMIAEYFDYEKEEDSSGTFVFLEDNHTSVLGMRAYAENITLLNSSDAFNIFRESSSELIPGNCKNNNSLFVYPAQSNFSGVKYPLHWIENVQRGILNRITEQKSQNWFVVLDAASYVSSNDLNLSLYKPDFVPISFYKIFGYPTGVGALLIRTKSTLALRKTYFGGGTVLMTLASENVVVPKTNLSDSFEDGSIPFLSILSIKHGLNTLKRLNLDFDVISKHTFSLAQYLFRNLLLLHHSNGKPAAILYSDTTFERSEEQGGIVNFNLLTDTGEYIGYTQVLHMCNLHKIHVRTGCSCNPGACQRHLQLTSEDVKKHFQVGHVCGDDKDLIENRPTGSIRVSFGYMSKREDLDVLLNMIEDCFVSKPAIMKFPVNWLEMKLSNAVKFSIYHSDSPIHILNNLESCNQNSSKDKYMKDGSMNELDNYWRTTRECSFSNNNGDSILERILLYPIKSCGPYEPKSTWAISRVGLEYDRQWMIVNESGTCITQKHDTRLCLIKPRIDLVNNKLRIFFLKLSNISIPLIPTNNEVLIKHEGKVGADQVIGMDCGDAVAAWLTKCLNYPGLRLVQQIIDANGNNNRINKKGESVNLSLANKAQYLLINTATAQRLHEKIIDRSNSYEETLDSLILRFRPNFVMNLKEPFTENNCDIINFNEISFKVTQNCTRCQMVCINQINGEKSKEPLITLMKDFKGKGGVQFGVYLLLHDALNKYVSVGSKVFITEKKNK